MVQLNSVSSCWEKEMLRGSAWICAKFHICRYMDSHLKTWSRQSCVPLDAKWSAGSLLSPPFSRYPNQLSSTCSVKFRFRWIPNDSMPNKSHAHICTSLRMVIPAWSTIMLRGHPVAVAPCSGVSTACQWCSKDTRITWGTSASYKITSTA